LGPPAPPALGSLGPARPLAGGTSAAGLQNLHPVSSASSPPFWAQLPPLAGGENLPAPRSPKAAPGRARAGEEGQAELSQEARLIGSQVRGTRREPQTNEVRSSPLEGTGIFL
jgi:hypothetical protein